MEKQWGVYILRCADGTLYTGISNNVEKRIQKHNNGKGAKYLEPARKRPAKRVFWEAHTDCSSATKREIQIKKMRRNDKLKLIKNA